MAKLAEFVGAIFGKKPRAAAMEEDDPDNYVWVIKKAKEELTAETGRKEFDLKEIWGQIHKKKQEQKEQKEQLVK